MDQLPVFRLHVFLSSPGDVSRERQLAREVIDRLESERLYRDRLKLEVVAWDKPGSSAPMPAHLEPQAAINKGLKRPSQCNIVIVIFWARMGTLLSESYLKADGSRYRSGTEYEFLDGLHAAKTAGKPDVLVYRRKTPPDVNPADPQREEKLTQWDLVEAFFAAFRNPDGSYKSFCKAYDEPYDFEKLLDSDLRDLIAQYIDRPRIDIDLPSEITDEPEWDMSISPFPGLRPFTPDESPIFFGRSRQIDQLIEMIGDARHSFITVVGASGSGKSSLVSAGLLPALENDAIPGSNEWVWLRFTPAEVGGNPFMALANAFKPIVEKYGQLPRDMAATLEANPEALNRFLEMVLTDKPKRAELLLFIDQFEEFFTLVDPKYHRGFVDLLARLTETLRVRVVVTMRSDFYHRCLDWPVLNRLIVNGQYPLLLPSVGALHEMIARPAERAGLRFEKELANRILDDTGTEPGALALMAYALHQLRKISEGTEGLLTHNAYEQFNGVQGAIGQQAETTFNSLAGERADLERILSDVFRELVEVDERGVPTRRRAYRVDVVKGKAAADLVAKMTEARLLVTSEAEQNKPMLEVAHEAIFTHWPRLKEWIEVRKDDLRLLRQVRLAASEWEQAGFSPHFLWPHERLVLVDQMVARMRPVFSAAEDQFILPESERLLATIDDAATSHQQRVKIGDRLEEIGDPRPGVRLRPDGLPDIAWCEVPKGKISLEGDAGSFRVDPFFIAKYPITWIQYRDFLKAADGYGDKGWWESLADPEQSPGRQYREQDNHPAENVSWYDAVAYCRWLSTHVGYEIRLPTEWEWQQAATGGDPSNTYPWGSDWDSNRANTYESGLSRTTAVGLYPQGASPVGALDMAGNVSEWCLNAYELPKNTSIGGDESRCLRGGSWDDFSDHARAANRLNNYFRPNNRLNYVGFRVCCASPIS